MLETLANVKSSWRAAEVLRLEGEGPVCFLQKCGAGRWSTSAQPKLQKTVKRKKAVYQHVVKKKKLLS